MERVRDAAASGMPVRRDQHFVPRRGGGMRHSLVGLALAAGIGSITTLSSLLPPSPATGSSEGTAVIGDTVVSALRDTLRLVRLMFDEPGARRVAVVGDFNGWRVEETPLRQDATTRRWSTTLALRDGAHRYAFVVDGSRWVRDPAAAGIRGDDGRVYFILHVARASN